MQTDKQGNTINDREQIRDIVEDFQRDLYQQEPDEDDRPLSKTTNQDCEKLPEINVDDNTSRNEKQSSCRKRRSSRRSYKSSWKQIHNSSHLSKIMQKSSYCIKRET